MQARQYGQRGPEAFGDAELLALVLGQRSAAAALLDRFGDLEGIASAQPTELQGVRGVGPVRGTRLHAALHAGRRSLRQPIEPAGPICTPADAAALLAPPLRGLAQEELHALYLDRRRRVLALRRLTVGSAAFTVVDPRQVFRPAVALGAASVVLAHNHPSGDPTPSSNDLCVTRRCVAAGRTLGIELVDHLVFGHPRWVSLAERGEIGG